MPKTPQIGRNNSRQNLLNKENLSKLDGKGSELLRTYQEDNFTITS